MVSFLTAIKNGFKKTFKFSGRATRAEYWWWQLFYFILIISTSFIFGPLGEATGIKEFSLVSFFVIIITWLPSFSLLVRRLHDAGHSGWNVLLNLVPLANILVFIYTLSESVPDNEYGPNPYQSTKNSTLTNTEKVTE